jgi:hypothetical protein
LKFHGNEQKKGTLKIQKSQIAVLVLNQSPISAVFTIVRFAGDPKTALTGDLLYMVLENIYKLKTELGKIREQIISFGMIKSHFKSSL